MMCLHQTHSKVVNIRFIHTLLEEIQKIVYSYYVS